MIVGMEEGLKIVGAEGGSSNVVGITDLPKSGGMEERAPPYLPSSGIPK